MPCVQCQCINIDVWFVAFDPVFTIVCTRNEPISPSYCCCIHQQAVNFDIAKLGICGLVMHKKPHIQLMLTCCFLSKLPFLCRHAVMHPVVAQTAVAPMCNGSNGVASVWCTCLLQMRVMPMWLSCRLSGVGSGRGSRQQPSLSGSVGRSAFFVSVPARQASRG